MRSSELNIATTACESGSSTNLKFKIMIPRTRLVDLYDDVVKQTSLMAIKDPARLLTVSNSSFTKWQVFFSIVRKAARVWNQYNPLNRNQKLYLNPNNDYECDVIDNFEDAIRRPDKYTDDIVVVMPTSVNGVSRMPLFRRCILMKNFSYDRGKFTGFFYGPGLYYAPCKCQYPLIEEYDEVTKEPTDLCGIYFLDPKRSGNEYNMFILQVFVCFCEYIRDEKENFSLQDLPVDFFGGLLNASQRDQQILDTFYQNSAVVNSTTYM